MAHLLLRGAVIAGLMLPDVAQAADGLDGKALPLIWILPFCAILLAIATGPLLYAHVWECHQGKIAVACAAAVIVPLGLVFGPQAALEATLHALLVEYMSFIILIFALFTIAGGILITGNVHGSPATNTVLLAIGMALASFVGTTGASMMLIRPLIRANEGRQHNVHVVVFFIFLVSNIGGALTPLGDPPLFVGFLRGVDFFWTVDQLMSETLFLGGLLLAIFFLLDSHLYKKEGIIAPDATQGSRFGISGTINLALLGGVIAAILLSGSWKPGIMFAFPGGKLELQNILRDGILVLLALASLRLTHEEHRAANGFSWEPIKEVAKLFAGIFICIVPVLAMLQAGRQGALAPLVALVTRPDGTPDNMMYFWMTGLLSSLLDNAPTYLVFFELAGGDPAQLMGRLAGTLGAISAGAVFMGAMTYVGNAPNFMVYAIARSSGVAMPSFFGYILWSMAILLPAFIVMSLLFIA